MKISSSTIYLLCSKKLSKYFLYVEICIVFVPREMYNYCMEVHSMEKENKSYSMSIRVSYKELEKLKRAARLESYSSYSEFVRRTALLESNKIIDSHKKKKTNI